MTDMLMMFVFVLAHGSECIPDLSQRVRLIHPHLVPPARSCASRSQSPGRRRSTFLLPRTSHLRGRRRSTFLLPRTSQLGNASAFRVSGQRCAWERHAPACFASPAVELDCMFFRSCSARFLAAATATPCPCQQCGTAGEWSHAEARPSMAAFSRVLAGPPSHRAGALQTQLECASGLHTRTPSTTGLPGSGKVACVPAPLPCNAGPRSVTWAVSTTDSFSPWGREELTQASYDRLYVIDDARLRALCAPPLPPSSPLFTPPLPPVATALPVCLDCFTGDEPWSPRAYHLRLASSCVGVAAPRAATAAPRAATTFQPSASTVLHRPWHCFSLQFFGNHSELSHLVICACLLALPLMLSLSPLLPPSLHCSTVHIRRTFSVVVLLQFQSVSASTPTGMERVESFVDCTAAVLAVAVSCAALLLFVRRRRRGEHELAFQRALAVCLPNRSICACGTSLIRLIADVAHNRGAAYASSLHIGVVMAAAVVQFAQLAGVLDRPAFAYAAQLAVTAAVLALLGTRDVGASCHKPAGSSHERPRGRLTLAISLRRRRSVASAPYAARRRCLPSAVMSTPTRDLYSPFEPHAPSRQYRAVCIIASAWLACRSRRQHAATHASCVIAAAWLACRSRRQGRGPAHVQNTAGISTSRTSAPRPGTAGLSRLVETCSTTDTSGPPRLSPMTRRAAELAIAALMLSVRVRALLGRPSSLELMCARHPVPAPVRRLAAFVASLPMTSRVLELRISLAWRAAVRLRAACLIACAWRKRFSRCSLTATALAAAWRRRARRCAALRSASACHTAPTHAAPQDGLRNAAANRLVEAWRARDRRHAGQAVRRTMGAAIALSSVWAPVHDAVSRIARAWRNLAHFRSASAARRLAADLAALTSEATGPQLPRPTGAYEPPRRMALAVQHIIRNWRAAAARRRFSMGIALLKAVRESPPRLHPPAPNTVRAAVQAFCCNPHSPVILATTKSTPMAELTPSVASLFASAGQVATAESAPLASSSALAALRGGGFAPGSSISSAAQGDAAPSIPEGSHGVPSLAFTFGSPLASALSQAHPSPLASASQVHPPPPKSYLLSAGKLRDSIHARLRASAHDSSPRSATPMKTDGPSRTRAPLPSFRSSVYSQSVTPGPAHNLHTHLAGPRASSSPAPGLGHLGLCTPLAGPRPVCSSALSQQSARTSQCNSPPPQLSASYSGYSNTSRRGERRTERSLRFMSARDSARFDTAVDLFSRGPRFILLAADFYRRLRSRCRLWPALLERRRTVLSSARLLLVPLATRFAFKLLVLARRRRRIRTLLCAPPKPLTDYTVGHNGTLDVDALAAVDWSGVGLPWPLAASGFQFCSPLGSIGSLHPTGSEDIPALAFSPDGSPILPLWPPRNSGFALVPAASGGLCYYDTDLGGSSWFPPSGSVPLYSCAVEGLSHPAAAPPPPLPPWASVGCPPGPWRAQFTDCTAHVTMHCTLTGATRYGPWVSLRDDCGCVFYANLCTRLTRWFPPPRWMCDWLSRAPDPATAELPVTCFSSHDVEKYDPRSPFARGRLPQAEARLRAEGAAPFLCSGRDRPHYPREETDTPQSYPAMDEADFIALDQALSSYFRTRPSYVHAALPRWDAISRCVVDRSSESAGLSRRTVVAMLPCSSVLVRFHSALMQRLRLAGGFTAVSWPEFLCHVAEPNDLCDYLRLHLPWLDALDYSMTL